MAAGNRGFVKTVNKASHWHVHGTHSVDPGLLAKQEREKLKRPKPEMFATAKEAFESMRKKRGPK